LRGPTLGAHLVLDQRGQTREGDGGRPIPVELSTSSVSLGRDGIRLRADIARNACFELSRCLLAQQILDGMDHRRGVRLNARGPSAAKKANEIKHRQAGSPPSTATTLVAADLHASLLGPRVCDCRWGRPVRPATAISGERIQQGHLPSRRECCCRPYSRCRSPQIAGAM